MSEKSPALYRFEPRRKYTFGAEQNASTRTGIRIIIPNEVAQNLRAWVGKSFPVRAFSFDRLGWYRAATYAMVVEPSDANSVSVDHGLTLVRFLKKNERAK